MPQKSKEGTERQSDLPTVTELTVFLLFLLLSRCLLR